MLIINIEYLIVELHIFWIVYIIGNFFHFFSLIHCHGTLLFVIHHFSCASWTSSLFCHWLPVISHGSWMLEYRRRSVLCLGMRRACSWWLTQTWSAALRAPSRNCLPPRTAPCNPQQSTRVGWNCLKQSTLHYSLES